ncbi:hypothetical protein DCAR_0313374 [Daucus carota subsp. sativus]|uniref:Uncharacterized protein n=1 Tax=Daucus carota subsp. sativus TaxID=79200 RepID=A0A166BZI8_DAUCS|nr:hypothetical protein DCAR_0313374 [Daucus carota subsp. sativus]
MQRLSQNHAAWCSLLRRPYLCILAAWFLRQSLYTGSGICASFTCKPYYYGKR